MSEEVIVRLGAPTLAGIKTGSLFTCAYTSRKSVEESLRQLNRCFAPKGLCLLPLRYSEKNVLLYLFRPAELSRDLQNSEAAELLRQEGYPCESCGKCLAALTRKLRSGEEFPHEIGLFLSYPPEDVKGFIENRAANYKLSGLWKVYGDEAKAQALFAKFKKCTEIYCALWQTGSKLEQLAVAV
mgnify:FL=1